MFIIDRSIIRTMAEGVPGYMKIVVCIKRVRYVYYDQPLFENKNEIDPEKMVFMINPYDEIAVEEAVRIKERYPGCEVVLITVGPTASEETLRYSFGLGGDRMIRIDYESSDPWSISALLSQTVQDLGFDIILCGTKAIDTNEGLVGVFMAEALNIPLVSRIVRLKVFPEDKKVEVDRYLGRGDRQVVECNLPALFTVEKGLNDPRYPTLSNILAAEREEIEVIDPNSFGFHMDYGMDLTQYMTLSLQRSKPKKIFTPDSHLSASERMRLLMTGHMTEKKGSLLEGKPEDIASKVVDVLIKEKVI